MQKDKQLGGVLSRLREELGLRPTEFAQLVRMDRTEYSSIEAGRRSVSDKKLEKIAKFYMVPVPLLRLLSDDSDDEFVSKLRDMAHRKVFGRTGLRKREIRLKEIRGSKPEQNGRRSVAAR